MTHGLTLTESATGVRTIKQASLAVIGIVATSTAIGAEAIAALNLAFPLDTAVEVSNIDAAVAIAGGTGTLKSVLEAIGDQTSPKLVVVRVATGVDQEATDENVIAGLQKLVTAESTLGLRPRILGAPGLDTLEVATELVIAAKKLRAMVYARAIGADRAAAKLYRENFTAREIMLIWPDTSTAAPGNAVARALGLRARIDEQQGWHKTISNVAIDGVTEVTEPVHFDLLDPSTEAGDLNDSEVTTIIRYSGGGFRFWGNRTCAGPDIPEFAFESAVRTSHALQDVIASAFQPFFDQPMTVALIKDQLETVNAAFRQLAIEGRIIGAQAFFDRDANSADQLAAGRPTFRMQFTPCAPLENPRVNLVITDFYYSGFADQIA